MGIRTNGYLRWLLLLLILADANTIHLHSTGFRTMVEAATLLDPHMNRLCAHQFSLRGCTPDTNTLNVNSLASLDLPMR
jgi:hypothetical protein